MNDLFRLWGQAELRSPTLIVGWRTDAGKLGGKVADYLNIKLGVESLGEIEPASFFSLAGVTIQDNLVEFPESKFYACPQNDLVIFKGDPPNQEWYQYLNLILDVAGHYGGIKELYVIGGMISTAAHTTPRELIAGFNSPKLKQSLSQYNLGRNLDYETPPGHRPTLNSFLLWVASRRDIPAVALWVPIPLYLVAVEDPRAQKKVLEFFAQRFGLRIDFQDINEEIKQQNERIAQARMASPEIDECISKLESNLTLSAEENEKLMREIGRFLTGKERGL
jgi:proteasome assembly chaperone (PAC2) family protein